MRPIERIDNFLSKIDWSKLIERWNIKDTENFYTSTPLFIASEWKNNSDLRFGQLLINRNDVEDTMQIWCDEEYDILLDQGVAPEECLYWTSCYDKDMNHIPEVSKLIKDLETDHINNIYTHIFKYAGRLSDKYRNAFRNVLVSRNEHTGTLDFIEQLWNLETTGE